MLDVAIKSAVHAQNGGLSIAHGRGIHPTRRIDSHELIFVRSGTLHMYEGEAEFDVAAGEALHLWPGREHGGTQPYDENLSFYWIHFSVDKLPPGKGGSIIGVEQHKKVSRPDHLTQLYRRFLDDQESGWMRPESADLLMLLILVEVSDSRPGESVELTGAQGLAARAHAYLRTHAFDNVSTSVVAAELRCNPDYLGRVYRASYGCSLTDTIHDLRVRASRRMLLESGDNIDEIARSCGYDDPGYFRRIFKRAEGMSPRAYRKVYGRVHVNVS